jgi:hypothetical protein
MNRRQFRQEYPLQNQGTRQARYVEETIIEQHDHMRGVFEKKTVKMKTLSEREMAELDNEPLPDPVEGGRAERLKARKQPLED